MMSAFHTNLNMYPGLIVVFKSIGLLPKFNSMPRIYFSIF
jgi:hypothetical protein